MSDQTKQILNLFKQGMSAEDIAADLEYPVEQVKAVLTSIAPREVVKRQEDISDEDYKAVLNELVSVAKFESENLSAKVKAAIFVINEKKGRNENAVGNVGKGLDIAIFNVQLRQARRMIKDILEKPEVVIDVQTTKVLEDKAA